MHATVAMSLGLSSCLRRSESRKRRVIGRQNCVTVVAFVMSHVEAVPALPRGRPETGSAVPVDMLLQVHWLENPAVGVCHVQESPSSWTQQLNVGFFCSSANGWCAFEGAAQLAMPCTRGKAQRLLLIGPGPGLIRGLTKPCW